MTTKGKGERRIHTDQNTLGAHSFCRLAQHPSNALSLEEVILVLARLERVHAAEVGLLHGGAKCILFFYPRTHTNWAMYATRRQRGKATARQGRRGTHVSCVQKDVQQQLRHAATQHDVPLLREISEDLGQKDRRLWSPLAMWQRLRLQCRDRRR